MVVSARLSPEEAGRARELSGSYGQEDLTIFKKKYQVSKISALASFARENPN
jgi:hypothetical protein